MIAFTVVNEETDQHEAGNKPQATLVSRKHERGEAIVSTGWNQMPGYMTVFIIEQLNCV